MNELEIPALEPVNEEQLEQMLADFQNDIKKKSKLKTKKYLILNADRECYKEVFSF